MLMQMTDDADDGRGGGGNWPIATALVENNTAAAVMGGVAQTVCGRSTAIEEPVAIGAAEEVATEAAVAERPDFYGTLSKQQRKYWRRRNLRK
jgi:hypothetical protein